ncbi:hypothetical protein [Alkalihalobacillus deserti]|uniref:hypothetical protein n=1 Tax=Alkalihalobacillus deserti TaxID=2879466 RepID=UPI001D13B99C|nr:hypothetical protein [Alkalihalobacillus deserti]
MNNYEVTPKLFVILLAILLGIIISVTASFTATSNLGSYIAMFSTIALIGLFNYYLLRVHVKNEKDI